MQLVVLGLNHHHAPLSIREKLAFSAQELPHALAHLRAHQVASEVAIVSTCNRTELYCNSQTPDALRDWLSAYHHLPVHEFAPFLYTHIQGVGARHAFRVACGLDSMVLGETQILGQLKDAVSVAKQSNTLGILLNHVFQSAFSVAKSVRSQTDIGANSVSMAAAAVRLAEQIFPSIEELNVLFIGAGEMIELVATHYVAARPNRMSITNRTPERAHNLAEKFSDHAVNIDVLPLEALAEFVHEFDVIITSTGSPTALVTASMMVSALKKRRYRPVFMLDLAVPRDVEAECSQLNDIFLYSVDDLASVVEAGKDARKLAAIEAEQLIAAEVEKFEDWLAFRALVPVIRALREQGEQLRLSALTSAQKRLARGDDPQKVLESFSQQLMNKFLHSPTLALNQAPAASRHALRKWVCTLFDLNVEE